MKRWYVVQVYTGFEDIVKKDLEMRVLEENMQDLFGQILIPTGEVASFFSDSKSKKEKIFPGYLLVQMEMTGDVIERTVSATPQADIKEREERLKNLKGIFIIVNKNKLIGREVLLVDDICTTGATLNECAKVLKVNGVTKVVALVIARG